MIIIFFSVLIKNFINFLINFKKIVICLKYKIDNEKYLKLKIRFFFADEIRVNNFSQQNDTINQIENLDD